MAFKRRWRSGWHEDEHQSLQSSRCLFYFTFWISTLNDRIYYIDYTQMRFIQSIIMSFISMIDPWSHFCRNPQLLRLNGSPRTHPKIAVRLSSLLQLRICSTRAGDSSWSVKAWWWGVERTFWIIIVFFLVFFLIFINHSCCWKTSIDPMPSSMIYHAVT